MKNQILIQSPIIQIPLEKELNKKEAGVLKDKWVECSLSSFKTIGGTCSCKESNLSSTSDVQHECGYDIEFIYDMSGVTIKVCHKLIFSDHLKINWDTLEYLDENSLNVDLNEEEILLRKLGSIALIFTILNFIEKAPVKKEEIKKSKMKLLDDIKLDLEWCDNKECLPKGMFNNLKRALDTIEKEMS